MKYSKLLLALGASTMLLGGCNKPIEAPQEAESTSEDSHDPVIEKQWDENIQEALLQYAGEVLPYAYGIDEESLFYEESLGEYGEEVLYIEDESTSFSITSYWQALEGAGWTVEKDDSGSAALIDEYGETYYHASKYSTSLTECYDIIIYYYYDWMSDSEGNMIQIVHYHMSNELSENTSWASDETSSMNAILEYVIPFVRLGKDYIVRIVDDFNILIRDDYYQNLVNDYASTLRSNSFNYDEEASTQEGVDVYTKTVVNQGKWTIYLNYSFGNSILVNYECYKGDMGSWPTSLVQAFLTEAGHDELELPASPNTSSDYGCYSHNGKLYIESFVTNNEAVDTYITSLLNKGLILVDSDTLTTWDGKVEIDLKTKDGDSHKTLILVLSKGTPATIFSQFPEDDIEAFVKTNFFESEEATYELPTFLTGSVEDGIKVSYQDRDYFINKIYEMYLEAGFSEELARYYALEDVDDWYTKDDYAIEIAFYNFEKDMATQFKSSFEGLGYYVVAATESTNAYAESLDGSVKYEFFNSKDNTATLIISKGSGETHNS